MKSMVFYKFDLNERELYETFFELLNFYQDVKKDIDIVPIYNIAPTKSQQKEAGLFCLNETAFCESRQDRQVVDQVDEPLFESMRQICLARQSIDAWWVYVSEFYKNCMQKNPSNNDTILEKKLSKCSDKIVDGLNPDAKQKLRQCMQAVQGSSVLGQSDLHKYLFENYNLKSMVDSPISPSVMINGQVLYGRLESIDILKEICASLISKPNQCQEIEKLTHSIHVVERGFTFFTAIWYLVKLILIGAILTGAFYMLYKIKLRKDMENKLNTEVDSALSNYYMQNRSSKYEGVEVEESRDDSVADHSKISLDVDEGSDKLNDEEEK